MRLATALIAICCIIAFPGSVGGISNFQQSSHFARVSIGKEGAYQISHGKGRSSMPVLAEVQIELGTNTTGWSYVYAWTNGSYADVEQAYSAGYLEVLIDPQVRLQLRNSMGGSCWASPNSTFCRRLHGYLATNLAAMRRTIVARRHKEPFWHQVELLLWQTQGMDDALKRRPLRPAAELVLERLDVDPFGMFLVQMEGGDVSELSDALKPPAERRSFEERAGDVRCSGLVKRTAAGLLLTAHDTWTTYSSMLRHMKLYEFNFRETASAASPFIAGAAQAFSSYPGNIMSIDDFYVTGSSLVVFETTNAIYNDTLLKIIRDSADSLVFEFLRTQVANRLARSIAEWQRLFAHRNSGTYNNQWVVVDYKKVGRDHPLPSSGVLGVSEQIPGLVVSKDMTSHLLNTSYWPSYNTPFFPEIYDRSEFWLMARQYGDFFVYNSTARAKIFRRDHSKVVDEFSMIRLMRYNDFKRDPLSYCNCTPPYSGENTIAARNDLNPHNGTYPISVLGYRNHGATDMKLAVPWLLSDLGFIGVSSPTFDQQPPFRWSTSGFNAPHFGQPDLWLFRPIITPWRRVRGWSPTEKSFFMDPNNIVTIPY